MSRVLVPWFLVLVLCPPSALWKLWESRSVFCGGFSKQLEEIINKTMPQATLFDFLSCGSFHSAPRSLFFLEMPGKPLDRFCKLKKANAPGGNLGLTRVINPLSLGAN